MASESIIARYRIETCLPLAQVAETIAGEQSSGTFLPVPGETEELKARARARVLGIGPLDEAGQPSLPGTPPAASRTHTG
ncbi:MAG TPA: ribulose 1,5-bisphosphate carboxylase, partial [Verrucomicrobiota bacterium]|nr:ribulose 1,5-bisphosphate carboxylase [Verrucomicrobiota bacterium]